MEQINIKLLKSQFDFEATREIYLAFQSDIEYPFSRFMKEGFKHVFAMERQALGWICIDPSRNDLCSTILPASYHVDIIPQFMINNTTTTILKLIVKQTDSPNYPRPGLISCVSCMQYLIGVYWPFILTPYQLYNKLCSNNFSHIEVTQICQGAKKQDDKRKNLLMRQRRQGKSWTSKPESINAKRTWRQGAHKDC